MTLTNDRYINLFTDYGFKEFFELAEIDKMDEGERAAYEDSLKDYRDLKSAIDTYYKDGKMDKAVEIAISLFQTDLTNEEIAKHTGLSIGQIEKLRKEGA